MRSTYPTAVVLAALAHGHGYGFEIIDVTGLRAGTVYPILRRLEAEALVRSSWERPGEARTQGRPPRRNYRLTAAGQTAVHETTRAIPGHRAPVRGGGRMSGPGGPPGYVLVRLIRRGVPA